MLGIKSGMLCFRLLYTVLVGLVSVDGIIAIASHLRIIFGFAIVNGSQKARSI